MLPLNYQNTGVTVELRELIENGVKLWDFEYPSYYKGEEKTAFEQKVIDHYWFRQIGQETTGRFLHCFRSRVREIMPYYIRLYKSQELMDSIEDPFGNVNMVETFEQESTGTRSGTVKDESTSETSSETTGTHTGKTTVESDEINTSETTEAGNVTTSQNEDRQQKFSDTPQGSISNIENYMTTATVENNGIEKTDTRSDNTTTEGSTTSNSETNTEGSEGTTASGSSSGTYDSTTTDSESGTVRHTLTRKGNHGVNTYAHDMKEYREILLNIDMQIINELNDLFLMVY